MREYLFDVTLYSTARIRADTIDDALKQLHAVADYVPPQQTAVMLTTACVAADVSRCIEIDGVDLLKADTICAYCDGEVKLVGGEWVTDADDHPELCSSNNEGHGHSPWETFRCTNCGHTDREDEFTPSDGRPVKHCCPKCESVSVFSICNLEV